MQCKVRTRRALCWAHWRVVGNSAARWLRENSACWIEGLRGSNRTQRYSCRTPSLNGRTKISQQKQKKTNITMQGKKQGHSLTPHTRTHTHTRTCTHTHMHTHAYTHTHVHTQTHPHTYTHPHTHTTTTTTNNNNSTSSNNTTTKITSTNETE